MIFADLQHPSQNNIRQLVCTVVIAPASISLVSPTSPVVFSMTSKVIYFEMDVVKKYGANDVKNIMLMQH